MPKWKPSPEVIVALIVSALLWLFLLTTVAQAQETCPVWSAPADEDGDVLVLIEFLPVSRVAAGYDNETGHLLAGGPGYGSTDGYVCFDVDTVGGSPSPGAEARAKLLGMTVCYRHMPDGTVLYGEQGVLLYPDPERTAVVEREVCAPKNTQPRSNA